MLLCLQNGQKSALKKEDLYLVLRQYSHGISHPEIIAGAWPKCWWCPGSCSFYTDGKLWICKIPSVWNMILTLFRDYHFLLLTPSCHLSKTTPVLKVFFIFYFWQMHDCDRKTRHNPECGGGVRVPGCDAVMQQQQHGTRIINPGLHMQARKNTNPPLDLACSLHFTRSSE